MSDATSGQGPHGFPPPIPRAPMPPPTPGTGASSRYPPEASAPHQPNYGGPYVATQKSLAVAYLLWLFLGFLGVHHFYLGKIGRGVGYLLTFAWFMIGWFVDLFTLPAQVKRVNYERRSGLR